MRSKGIRARYSLHAENILDKQNSIGAWGWYLISLQTKTSHSKANYDITSNEFPNVALGASSILLCDTNEKQPSLCSAQCFISVISSWEGDFSSVVTQEREKGTEGLQRSEDFVGGATQFAVA